MSWWLWLVIAVAVGVALGAVAGVAIWQRRSRELRRRFGPEYDRTVKRRGSRFEAELELKQRPERREQLEIKDLDAGARSEYRRRWEDVQAQFVDGPDGAVANAHTLIRTVLAERGYPVDELEQRVADVSVDHPDVVEHYRQAQAVAERSARGEASTEDLRRAMQHYRTLFDDLLDGTRSSRDDAINYEEGASK